MIKGAAVGLKFKMAVLKLMICLSFIHLALGKGSEAQVQCTPEVMKVTVPLDGDRIATYLNQMKEYQPCKPAVEGNVATYLLDLQDPHKCGVVRVLHKESGKRIFYHTIVIEDNDGGQETVLVQCYISGKQHTVTRRDVPGDLFPVDLNEPEVVNITGFKEGHAPIPRLVAVVKQNGKQVSGEISVSPGTPLSMEISLDKESAPVYGLLVSYMHVTDTEKQQETIILNGCSLDPYLFDNFVTSDGDLLAAKFKAFKFPDTTYVQFKGTISVCLDKCQGIQCSNGALGYGRRRRSIESTGDSNKLYEVSLTTFIKVEWVNGTQQAPEDVTGIHLKNLGIANQMLGDSESVSVKEVLYDVDKNLELVKETFEETITSDSLPGKSNILTFSCLLTGLSIIIALFK